MGTDKKPTYKTPGVYVEEVSTLPPSVAAVATAIPAFVGYTEKGTRNAPTRISSFPDYVRLFGGVQPTEFTISRDEGGSFSVRKTGTKEYLMYYALKMYFDNGGGACYVVSIGGYKEKADSKDGDEETVRWQAEDFKHGIDALKKEDEPTLIVLSDAVNLTTLVPDRNDGNKKKLDIGDYAGLCSRALDQCGELKDRFTIIDVPQGGGEGGDSAKIIADRDRFRNVSLGTQLKYGAAYYPYLQTTLNYVYDEEAVDINVVEVKQIRDGTEVITQKGIPDGTKLSTLKDSDTKVYNEAKAELAKWRVVLPPSCAMAGIYAKVDRERGVWKAPANVGVTSVIGPTLKITHADQEDLNVDPTAGKSINAIRVFAGKGTLVWGARTLAGNDNEWRYVNVRRLFNMIEESTQKATSFAVFEGNDATTWLKVKGMIESFLYGLWEQGALAGPTPESAYFVNVGLGTTMTTQDILEGRMIVEIGVAAVRPAEFIIIKFSHKLQEA